MPILGLRFIAEFVAVSAGVLLLSLSANADSCAKLDFQSAADSCEKLRASLDVSGCGDELASKLKVKCSSGQARIEGVGKKSVYVARVELKEGAWNAREWVLASELEVRPIRKASVEERSSAAAGESRSQPASDSVSTGAPQSPTPPSSPWSVSGIFDAYYAFNFNRPNAPSAISATSVDSAAVRPPQNALRYYDWYSRQLGLNLIEITPKYSKNGVTVFVDFDFGQMADINAASAASSGYVVDEVSKHVGQAVLSYSPPSAPGLVIEIGKMASHVGLEVIKARDNWNYSRSVTFGFGSPFWHTGARLGYAFVPDRWMASVYVYNGWNTITDINSVPTLGAQLKFTPSASATIIYNYIGGPEQAGNHSNQKQIHEANATVSVAQNFSLGIELLTGSEEGVASGGGKATWNGATLAAKWQVSSSYSISPRFELYRDNQGYTTGVGTQSITTYTLTNGLQIADGLEMRLEGRWDHSTLERFSTPDGTSQNQVTALAALLYSFM